MALILVFRSGVLLFIINLNRIHNGFWGVHFLLVKIMDTYHKGNYQRPHQATQWSKNSEKPLHLQYLEYRAIQVKYQ